MPTPSSKSRTWYEITVFVEPIAHEALSHFLFEMGCEGLVVLDRPTPGLKAYVQAEAWSEEKPAALECILKRVQELFPGMREPRWGLKALEDQDWDLLWRKFFKPERISSRLMVLPAWETPPSEFPGHILRIDPGPAFGTGHHPTTRMCLQALEEHAPTREWTLVDVGTGSGILAIYGKMLGAGRVVAIDTDPEAARWARRNIRLNGLEEGVEVCATPLTEKKGPFTLLVANITLETILELLPLFPKVLLPGGKAILSGILKGQKEAILSRLRLFPLEPCETRSLEEWVCLVAINRGPNPGGHEK